MNSVISKIKWFIICALVVVVVGMTLFGVFGFNNTVDYQKSYELNVTVDQSIDEAKEVIRTSSNKYLNDKGIKAVDFAYQELDGGFVLIYKFTDKVQVDTADFESVIDTALSAETKTQGVLSSVSFNEVTVNVDNQYGYTLLAIGVALIALFVYALFMEKLSGAVAIACSSIGSFVVYVSLVAITRLPVINFVSAISALSFAIGGALSATTVNRYREEFKNSTSKPDVYAIVNNIASAEWKKYLFTAIVAIVAGVAISAFIKPYAMIVGAHIVLAVIASTVTAFFMSPLIWSAIKGKKK